MAHGLLSLAGADRLASRATLRWLHRWLGIVVGVVFALIGLTGTVVTYGPEWLAWRNAELAAPPPDGWHEQRAAVLERTLAEHPPGDVQLVRFPSGPFGAYEIYLAGEREEYRHALDGRVLHARGPWADVVKVSREVHTHLAAGETGERVLGWLGVAMLVLLISGAWLWWPRNGRWRAALRYPPRGGRLHWWHRSAGAASVLLLGFLTLTGVAMVFYATAQAVLTGAFGGTPPTLPERTEARGAPDWAAVLATLDREMAEGPAIFLYPPATENAPVIARKRLPGEWHPNGRSTLAIAADGAVLARHDARDAGAGLRATYAIYPLHAGRTGSTSWKVLVAVAGIAPAAFFVTGWVLWRRRTPARSVRRAA